jgi:hypothetical protein
MLTYHPKNKTFSGDASEMMISQVSEFTMFNTQTRVTEHWVYEGLKRDIEDDIMYWHYRSFESPEFALIIFND